MSDQKKKEGDIPAKQVQNVGHGNYYQSTNVFQTKPFNIDESMKYFCDDVSNIVRKIPRADFNVDHDMFERIPKEISLKIVELLNDEPEKRVETLKYFASV